MPEQKPFPFKMGADPEFNILIKDRHFKADALFRSLFNDKLKAKPMGYEVGKAGEVGWDGNSDIGELRPNPSNKPEEITANLKKLIKTIVDQNPLLELSTLSDMGTVGGHIHFELPPMSNSSDVNNYACRLHKKLSSFYIPLIMGEDLINLRTRTRTSYGKITDYRTGQHTNSTTYEFRVPSAEWLTTERITKATMAYFGTIYNEIQKHPKNFAKCNNFIFKNEKQGLALQSLAISHFDVILNSITHKIRKNIRTFEFYPQYEEEINFILSPEKVLKEKQTVNYNMTLGWNLIKLKQPSKRELFARVNPKTTFPNLDTMIQIIPIGYNPDINVIEFVNALRQKMALLNWRLNNNYYFFGLKQGIKDFIIRNKANEYLYGKEQLQTENDRTSIEGTFKRMSDKFYKLKTRESGKEEEIQKKYIMIGIPYDLRMASRTKPMLELVYDIEKNKINGSKVDNKGLPEFIEIDGKRSYGLISDIYNKETNELENTLSNESRLDQSISNRIQVEREIAQENDEN